ncbi:hypothetical protein V3C99_012395 [Haemonchus contortus]
MLLRILLLLFIETVLLTTAEPTTDYDMDAAREDLYTSSITCPGTPYMDDRSRGVALDVHNYRRSQLAKGYVKNKKGRNLPQASNMIKLEYDCDLEKSGTDFVKCKESLEGSPLLGVKKNHLYFAKDRAGDRRQAIRFAVKHWWSRVRKDGGIGQEVTFKEGNAGRPISAFTKMAWATTEKVGCVARECPDHWSVVCLYNPGGNQVGSHIYERGSPCTACPKGFTCNADSLCEMSS